jgi:hypothetical protein
MNTTNIPYIPYCQIIDELQAKEAFQNGFKIHVYWKANKYYEDSLKMYRKAKVWLFNHTQSFEDNIQFIKVKHFLVLGEIIFYKSPDKYPIPQQKQVQIQPTLF